MAKTYRDLCLCYKYCRQGDVLVTSPLAVCERKYVYRINQELVEIYYKAEITWIYIPQSKSIVNSSHN